MDKKILTIQEIKKVNKMSGCISIFVVGFLSIFVIVGISMFIRFIRQDNMPISALICPLMFVLIPGFMGGLMLKNMMRDRKENKLIDNGEFKVVEDIICKKNTYTTKDNDGHRTRHYEFYTDGYGRISTDSFSYKNANEGDLIYLVVYNDRDEADQGYLVNLYELDSELRSRLVTCKSETRYLNINTKNNINHNQEENSDNTWWN